MTQKYWGGICSLRQISQNHEDTGSLLTLWLIDLYILEKVQGQRDKAQMLTDKTEKGLLNIG